MLIYDKFISMSSQQAAKPCLIFGEKLYTYQQISERVNLVASHLAAQIKKGDRVLVKLANPVKALLHFFAVVKAGGVCVLIDPAASVEVCTELAKAEQILFTITEDFVLPAKTALLPKITEADLFLGALSSGSTGMPKVIWRDHQSWVRAFSFQSQLFNLCANDTLYLAGSLAYSANLNACVHMLSEGGTVVLAGSSMPRTWLKEMRLQNATAIFMVPANYRILLKVLTKPLTGINSIVSCGAKLDHSTAKALLGFFPNAAVVEYYGASELGHVSYLTGEDLLTQSQSVGKPFPHVKITIEENVIWAESPYLAPKYRPKATVGDLGRVDGGYLYLLGRKTGLINTGGIKVIPEQVEDILRECPGVADAAVAGLDDSVKGQKVCAWIVRTKKELAAADILAFCHKKMRPHYCPQKIMFVEDFPLNANSKVDKKRLIQDMLASRGRL
ncbi:MAG: AMP-binding protein [Pelosinus sp.]|nr:AMP-binding protein [Pelosinus sp.]